MEEELDEVEAGKRSASRSSSASTSASASSSTSRRSSKRWNARARDDRRQACERVRRSQDARSAGARTAGSSAARATRSARAREISGRTATAPPPPRETDYQLRQVRQADGHQDRALRRVPLVHGLPDVQERAARAARRPVPEVRRRHHRDPPRRRGGAAFYGCSNYNAEHKCDFKLWQKPIAEPCPLCGAKFLVFGGGKKNPMLICVDRRSAAYKKPIEEAAPPRSAGGTRRAASASAASRSESGGALSDSALGATALRAIAR